MHQKVSKFYYEFILELVSNYNGSFVVQKLIKLLIPKKREIVIQEIERVLKTTLTQGKLFFKWKDFINNIKEKYPVNKFKTAIFHPNPLEKVKIRGNIQKVLEHKVNITEEKSKVEEQNKQKSEVDNIIEKQIKSIVKSNKLQLKIENLTEPPIHINKVNENSYNTNKENNKIRIDTLPKNVDAINNSLNYQFYNSPTKHSSDVNYYPSNMNSSQSINNYNYQGFNNSYIPQNMSMSNMFPSNNHYCYSNSSLPITNTNSMMLNNNFNLLNQQNQFLNAYQNQNFNYSQSNSPNSSLTNIYNMRSPLNQSYNSINMGYNINPYNNLLNEVDMISPNFRSDISLTKRVSNTNNNSQQFYQNQIMGPFNNNVNSFNNPQINNSNKNQHNYLNNMVKNTPNQNLSNLNSVETRPDNYNSSLSNSLKVGFINMNDSGCGHDSIEKKRVNYNLLINNQTRNEFDSRNNTGNLLSIKKNNFMNNMLGNKSNNLDSVANISPSDSPVKERTALRLKDTINSPNKLDCKLNSGSSTKNAGSSKFLKFIKEKNEKKIKVFPDELDENSHIKNDDNNNPENEQSITNNKIKIKVSFNVPTKEKKLSVKENVKEKSFTNNLFNNLNSPTKVGNYNANTGNLSLKLNINSLKDENMRDSNYLNLFNTNQDYDKSDKSSTITPNNNLNEHIKLNQESCFRNTGNLQKFGVKKNSFSTACNEIAEYENVLNNTPSQLGSIAELLQIKTTMNNNTSNLPNLGNLRTQLISKNETQGKQSVFGFADLDKADKMNKKLTIDDSIESEIYNLFENNEEKSENTRESSRKTFENNLESINKGLKTSPINLSSNNNISNFKLILKK